MKIPAILAGATLIVAWAISNASDLAPEIQENTDAYKTSVDMHLWNNATTAQAIDALESYNGSLDTRELKIRLIILDNHGIQWNHEKTLAYQQILIKTVEELNNGTISTGEELKLSIQYALYKMSYHQDTQEEYI
jgi:DNA integrity scanning protein DisA with diadenylate cyclase activity